MFLEVIGSERLSGENARERRDLAKHRRILIIRVREKKRKGGKRERKKESRKKKEKNELKKKLIPENTDVFAKLVNSGSCREAVPLISAETFHDRVRTLLQIVRANISESSVMPFVMRMKRNKERREKGGEKNTKQKKEGMTGEKEKK